MADQAGALASIIPLCGLSYEDNMWLLKIFISYLQLLWRHSTFSQQEVS